MMQPEALAKNEPLIWSTGKGTDVWAMFRAAATGDIAALQLLLKKDPSLIRCNYDYRNPISFAVCENQPAAVQYLLEQGAGPVESGTTDTLIQIARDRGYTAIQQLLEKALGRNGTPGGEQIAEAIRKKDIKKVKNLLDTTPELINARDDGSSQPIHWAVMTRQPELIDELLQRGADINAQRFDGARPVQLCNGDYSFRGRRDVPESTKATPRDILHHLLQKGAQLDIGMAALIGDIHRVKELLAQDASLANRVADYVSYYPGSGAPLKNAVIGGHIEMVQLLLDHGADPNLPEEGIAPRGHALHSAVVYGHYAIAKLLLEQGAYPNVEIESSADTLSAALSKDDKPMIELLCSYGAARKVHLLAYSGDIVTAAAVFDANPALANDTYALECAAGEGHAAFVRLMLRYQPGLAKRMAVGVASRGPDHAVQSRELVEYLFQQGMNPNFKNWLGITPLHRFASRDDVTSAAIFIEHGADVNVVDEQFYSTPLGYAAKYGQPDMVKFLLEKGADPNLPLQPAWAKPLPWAKRRGYEDIIKLLQENDSRK